MAEQNTAVQFVYMLLCADNSLYSGWTTHLAARITTHNSGHGAKYTKPRRPVQLVYYEVLPDKPAALRREHALKALTRTEKLALVQARGCLTGLNPQEAEAAARAVT